MQALKRFRAGHDGLATFLTPIVAQSCFNVFNVHTEIKLILILILIHWAETEPETAIREAKSFKFCTVWTKIEISKSGQIF